MHPIMLMMVMGFVIAIPAGMKLCFDMFQFIAMQRALIRKLAHDPEFIKESPQVWDWSWQDERFEAQFRKLSAIVRRNIDQLGFKHPRPLTELITQPHLGNRLNYMRGLASDVQKRLHCKPQ